MSGTKGTDRAAAVIPARFGSSRFPGKVLADLCGKPVLQRVFENCLSSDLFERVIVATDSKEVQRRAEGFGAEVVITAPDHRSGTERVAEAASSLSEQIIFNVQGDEPFIGKSVLEPMLALFDDEEVLTATLMTAIKRSSDLADPGAVKVVVDARGYALYFSRWPIPFHRRLWLGDDPWRNVRSSGVPESRRWWHHLGIYAFRRDTLLKAVELSPPPAEECEELEQLRLLHFGIPIRCLAVEGEFVGIDTPEDLERAKALLEEGSFAG